MKVKGANRQPSMTSFSERLSYWSYFAGQSMSYTMLGGFLTSYMLMIGVDIGKIAAAMLVVKVWDAVNDTIFGIIFDRVKFKSGQKCLPWLRITAVLIPVATVLIYLIPAGLSPTFKIIWFIVGYILWDTSYTLSDVPIYSLATTMTSELHERNKLLSIARIYALGSAFVVSMLCTVLVSEQVGLSFTHTAMVVAVLAAGTMLPIVLKGKERVKPAHTEEDAYTLRGMLHYLKSNKYLLLYYSGYILFGVCATTSVLGLFVSYYLFGSALFSLVLQLVSSLPMLIVSLFINKVLLKVDKFKLFFACNLLYAAVGVVMYFVGYGSMALYITLMVLNSVPMAVIYILNLTFTPDCVEYGQYKTGIDARGIAFAIQSFAAKFASLAQPLALFILGLFGWLAVEAGSFSELDAMVKAGTAVQSAGALGGLWFTYTLVPAIGAALALIPYAFYKLNDKDVQVMTRYNAGEITRQDAEAQLSRRH